jgi:hypothetical protein
MQDQFEEPEYIVPQIPLDSVIVVPSVEDDDDSSSSADIDGVLVQHIELPDDDPLTCDDIDNMIWFNLVNFCDALVVGFKLCFCCICLSPYVYDLAGDLIWTEIKNWFRRALALFIQFLELDLFMKRALRLLLKFYWESYHFSQLCKRVTWQDVGLLILFHFLRLLAPYFQNVFEHPFLYAGCSVAFGLSFAYPDLLWVFRSIEGITLLLTQLMWFYSSSERTLKAVRKVWYRFSADATSFDRLLGFLQLAREMDEQDAEERKKLYDFLDEEEPECSVNDYLGTYSGPPGKPPTVLFHDRWTPE